MNYYRCGIILTTHGIKGDLKIKSTSDFNRFYNGNKLYVFHNNEYILVELKNVRPFKDYYLCQFVGYEDINLAQKFHSNEIFVSDLDREKLNEGEFYYSDLIGKDCYNTNNEYLGNAIDIEEIVNKKYLVIKTKDEKRVLVPFIYNEFINEVSDDKIIINEIEGLF